MATEPEDGPRSVKQTRHSALRELRDRFGPETVVRKIASPDRIQHFLPPGGSRISEE